MSGVRPPCGTAHFAQPKREIRVVFDTEIVYRWCSPIFAGRSRDVSYFGAEEVRMKMRAFLPAVGWTALAFAACGAGAAIAYVTDDTTESRAPKRC